jgi:hypothetical protein
MPDKLEPPYKISIVGPCREVDVVAGPARGTTPSVAGPMIALASGERDPLIGIWVPRLESEAPKRCRSSGQGVR